jgi:hypothetical protein
MGSSSLLIVEHPAVVSFSHGEKAYSAEVFEGVCTDLSAPRKR